jgi:O-antigen ligase
MQHLDATHWLFASAVSTLLLALTFGGADQTAGDPAIQLSALITLGLAWHRLRNTSLTPMARAGIVLAAAAVALPLAQLLPLPATIANALPGRAAISSELVGIGADIASHVSLSPTLTERSLWALLPGLALFCAGLGLPPAARQRLLATVVIFALVSVVLGLAQLAGGPASPLRFYRPTHAGDAVGFFANRNHFASLLYVALVLTAGLLAVYWRRGAGSRPYAALGAAAVVFCLTGLALARSRMGLALGMLALLGAAAILLSAASHGQAVRRWLLVTTLIGTLAVVQIGLYGILSRLETDPLQDARWTFFANTHSLAARYTPLGSGFGTFSHAYQSATPPAQQQSFYVNHAHNDYLELALEGGWPAKGWAMAFVAWWLWCTWTAWRRPAKDHTLARAASLALLLLMLHAVVDYALRTSAILAVAGLLCATVTINRRISSIN